MDNKLHFKNFTPLMVFPSLPLSRRFNSRR